MAARWMTTSASFRLADSQRALSPFRQMVIHSTGAEVISLIGVDYFWFETRDGGDLYLTRFGVPFRDHPAPENWYAPDGFTEQRVRLVGTSAIYKVPTKPVCGISLDLVVRFSRVGEEVPLDALTLCENDEAEFNSPFEEIALVVELRAASNDASHPRIFTKKPPAICAPSEKLQDWQTGRKESKMAAKKARQPEVNLDVPGQYLLLYGWIEGLKAVQTSQAPGITGDLAEKFLSEVTPGAIRDLEKNRFRMLDIKPPHIVLRIPPDGSLIRRNGNLSYALLDYELLQRVSQTCAS
jgi:hypothetical protein